MSKTISLFAFILSLWAFPLAAEVTRLGIVSEDDQRSTADILTASLAAEKNVVVVERDQLNKILVEQSLAASHMDPASAVTLGRLLKADGIVLLSSVHFGKDTVAVARLLSVNSGTVFETRQMMYPIKDPAAWSSQISRCILISLPKFHTRNDEAVRISVQNLRSSPQATSLEEPLGLLLATRLTRQREFFVLERNSLGLLAGEGKLVPTEDPNFATSTYVVGGYIDVNPIQPENSTVTISVRAASGGDGQQFTVKGNTGHLLEMVDEIADNLVKLFKKPPNVAPSDPASEALNLGNEAMLAYRRGSDFHARSLAEASLALKPVSTNAAYVLINLLDEQLRDYHVNFTSGYRDLAPAMPMEMVFNTFALIAKNSDENPRYFNGFAGFSFPEDLDTVNVLLDSYDVFLAAETTHPELQEREKLARLGPRILLTASIPLIAARRDRNGANYGTQLVSIRNRLAELSDRLVAGNPPVGAMQDILFVKAALSYFWNGERQGIHDAVLALLRSYPGPDQAENRAAIRQGLVSGEYFARRYVTYPPAREAVAQLAMELSASRAPEDVFLGSFYGCESTPHDRSNQDVLKTKTARIYEALWNMREQVAANPRVLERYLAFEQPFVFTDPWMEKNDPFYAVRYQSFRGHELARYSDDFYQFYLRYTLYLLAESKAFNLSYYAAHLFERHLVNYTEPQCDQLIGALFQRREKFGMDKQEMFLWQEAEFALRKAFPTLYPADQGFLIKLTTPPSSSTAIASNSNFLVDRFWSPALYAKSLAGAQAGGFWVRELFWIEPNDLWVLGSYNRGDNDDIYRDAVFQIKIPSFETEVIMEPEMGDYYRVNWTDSSRLRVSPEAIYIAGQNRPLMKYNRFSGKWTVFDGVRRVSDACIARDFLYLGTGRQILAMSLKTDASITVADIHREPQKGPLDSPEWISLRLGGAVGNQVSVSGYSPNKKSARFLYDPASSTWSPAASGKNLPAPVSGYSVDQRLRGKCRFALTSQDQPALGTTVEKVVTGDPINYTYAGTSQGVLIYSEILPLIPGFWFVPESKIQEFINRPPR